MSKVYYLYGLPLERIGDNQFCPRSAGRPSGSGTYGERTEIRRIPESLLDEIDRMLLERRTEWERIREQVLNYTYCSPEIDLSTVQVVPRRILEIGSAPDALNLEERSILDKIDSTLPEDEGVPSASDGVSDVQNLTPIILTKKQRKAQKFAEKHR